MPAPYSREAQDALQALDRLVHRHKLLSLEQGKSAARLITGDEQVEFPPPRAVPPPAPASPPAARSAPDLESAPPAADPKSTSPPADGTSPPA